MSIQAVCSIKVEIAGVNVFIHAQCGCLNAVIYICICMSGVMSMDRMSLYSESLGPG